MNRNNTRILLLAGTLLLLFVLPSFKRPPLGMSYAIVPDRATPCTNDFGNGLSYFFEQVGGYEEFAEVSQVSRVLHLDLSLFQDVAYNYEDSKDVAQHWHRLDSVSRVVDRFIAAIKAHPDYYRAVRHNPKQAQQLVEMERIGTLTDSAEQERALKKLMAEPYYYYPADHGYLRSGRLLKDLQTLRHTLRCYQQHGVRNVRLEYQ